MVKNIILCSDGTGNQDIKNRGTNVFKIYEAVDTQGHNYNPVIKQQIAFYDEGVGTSRIPLLKVLGGAFGLGFSRNVKNLYHELANVYQEGDSIYLFGFSRGAYTIRALAGFIQYCKTIPDAERYQPYENLKKEIDRNWVVFRFNRFNRYSLVSLLRRLIQKIRGKRNETVWSHEITPGSNQRPIRFIGVWDTVSAIGVPFKGMQNLINWIFPIQFNDKKLGPGVETARHALSIDDERHAFSPELWDEKGSAQDRDRLKQVWFSGVHSNVGGGYPKHGMSLVALYWMMAEAIKADLRFVKRDWDFVKKHQDVHATLYDSRNGAGLYYRWNPRNIPRLCESCGISTPLIHLSVFERIAYGTEAYSPVNLPYDFDIEGDTPPISNKVKATVQGSITAENRSKGSSLLDENSRQVKWGKASYYVFLPLTLITFLRLLTVPWAVKILSLCLTGSVVDTKSLSETHQLLRLLLIWAENIPFLLILVLGILIYRWARWVDKSMGKSCRAFWKRSRSNLRKHFT